MDPLYFEALAALETAGGKKTVKGPKGEDSFNLYNIKDFTGKGFRAHDKAEGSNDAYRVYSSTDESTRDLIGLLSRKYPKALEATDRLDFAKALKAGGYATDPAYVEKFVAVYDSLAGRGDRPAKAPGSPQVARSPAGVDRSLNALYEAARGPRVPPRFAETKTAAAVKALSEIAPLRDAYQGDTEDAWFTRATAAEQDAAAQTKAAEDQRLLDIARAQFMSTFGGELLKRWSRPEFEPDGFVATEDDLAGFSVDEQDALREATSRGEYERIKFELQDSKARMAEAGRSGMGWAIAGALIAGAPEGYATGGLAALATANKAAKLAQQGRTAAALGVTAAENVGAELALTVALDNLSPGVGLQDYVIGALGGGLGLAMQSPRVFAARRSLEADALRKVLDAEIAGKEADVRQARANLGEDADVTTVGREVERIQAERVKTVLTEQTSELGGDRKLFSDATNRALFGDDFAETTPDVKLVEPEPATAAAPEPADDLTPPVLGDLSELGWDELDQLHTSAREHNRAVDLAGIRKFFGEAQAVEAEQWTTRQREAWLMKNETDEASDWMQARYVNDERIADFKAAVNQFDDSSPAALGHSIALVSRKAAEEGFLSTPEGATFKNAMRYAKAQGWSLDEVVAGMRERAAAWAGSDAPELFERLFRATTAKPEAPAAIAAKPTAADADLSANLATKLDELGEAGADLRDAVGVHWDDPSYLQQRMWSATSDPGWRNTIDRITNGRTFQEIVDLPAGVHVSDEIASNPNYAPRVAMIREMAAKYLSPSSRVYIGTGVTRDGPSGEIVSVGDVHMVGLVDRGGNDTHTAVHELGHAIFHERARHIPADLMRKIRADYGRFLDGLLAGSPRALAQRFAITSPNAHGGRIKVDETSPRFAYAADFDEYMAEQFVKHIEKLAIENDTRISSSLRQRLISAVKAVFEFFKDAKRKLLASPDEGADEFFKRVLDGTLRQAERVEEAPEFLAPDLVAPSAFNVSDFRPKARTVEQLDRIIRELGDRHVAGEIDMEQLRAEREKLQDEYVAALRRQHQSDQQAPAAGYTDVFPGFREIPKGTYVLATHGTTYTEPTRGLVVGSKDVKLGKELYRVPQVDFGDGRPRNIPPTDIREVFAPRAIDAGKFAINLAQRTDDDIAADYGLDTMPAMTSSQIAEQKAMIALYRKAEAYPMPDAKRISKLLASKPMGWATPTAQALLMSKNPVARMAAAELLESGSGAAGRRTTAAIAKWMHEREFMGNSVNDFQRHYKLWRNANGGGLREDAFGGQKWAEFNRAVALELENRLGGRTTAAPQAVRDAADVLTMAYERMRVTQQRLKTPGWAALPATSEGYMPHRMSAGKVRAMSPGQARVLHSVLMEQFEAIEGFDLNFSMALASKYIDIVRKRGTSGYSAPIGVHNAEAADIVEEAAQAMGMSRDEANALAKRVRRAAPKHTQHRLQLDLTRMYEADGQPFQLVDLFETDQLTLLRNQAARVSGEAALVRHGIMGSTGLKLLRRAMDFGTADGKADNRTFEAFDQVSAELLGQPFGTSRGLWMQRATQLNSLASLGGVGFNQLAETINGAITLGVRHALASVGSFGRLRAEILALSRGQQVNNPIIGSLETYGAEFGTDSYKLVFPFDMPDRLNETYGTETLTAADRLLRSGVHLQGKLSLWRAISAAQQRGMAEQIVHKALRYIRDGKDDVALADMGIDATLSAALRAELANVARFDGRGRLTHFDVTRLENRQAADAFVQAVHRGTQQIIQGTFIGETGRWAHSDLLKMMAQFRTFSLIAIDKQWNRQVGNHGTAKALGMLLGTMTFAAPIYMIRAGVQSLGREDQEAYLEEQLRPDRVARAVLNYVALSGGAGDLLDALSAVGGFETTGGRSGANKSFVGNIIAPAAGKLNDLWGAVQNNKDGTDLHGLAKELPFSRLPWLYPAVNALKAE